MENLTTLEMSGSSTRVGEKEDARERKVSPSEGDHRLTKTGEKSWQELETDLRPPWCKSGRVRVQGAYGSKGSAVREYRRQTH